MEEDPGSARVLYADGDDGLRDRVARRLRDGGGLQVEVVATVDEVSGALKDGDRVDCVLAGSTLDDGGWRDVADAVRDHDPDLPIVLYASEPDPSVASEATRVGVTEYLPRAYDEDGELLDRVRSVVADFQRVRTLRSESTRYEAVMETLPLSLYFKDADARYVDASRKLAGDVEPDIEGKTDAELWGDPDDPTGLETYRDDLAVVERGEPIEGKEEHHEIDGGHVWVRSSKYPWRDADGGVRGLVGVTRNVTEQKNREKELRQKSQRLEQFASFVSHDLRNPINIAQGYLDRARETGDDDAFDQVDDALDRMDTLVEDLLSTVRRGDESRDWIELGSFVERAWTATETEHVDLEIEVPEGTTIAAVPGQLRQLLDNLFRNADEHAGCDVTVTVGTTDVGFYVADDGTGIDPERREDVFEYGVTDGGTGIGLAIVSEIAATHGWDETLRESGTGGARFEFENCPIRREEFRTVEPGDSIAIDETADVGDPTPPSSFERGADGESWTAHAGGHDVWQHIEEHFFAYGTVEGGARIVARVADLEHVSEYSKAGVMVRDWADTGSSLAYVGATPEHGSETIYRTFPGEDIETEQFVDVGGAPRWYRIDWIDNTVTFETSSDGEKWTTLDRRAVAGHDPVCVGIAVCSHDPEQACRAVFEDVRVVELRPTDSDD